MISRTIGILGSGIVGQTLGGGFIKYGCEVMIGSRDPSKLSDWKSKHGKQAQTGSPEQAAKFGDLIVLATKGTAARDALNLAGLPNFEGKTIIDACNPIGNEPPQNGVLHFFTDINWSLMEDLQAHVPNAFFVKAFSCVGSHFMVDPHFEGGPPTMFICGNSDAAKSEVKDILNTFGWEIEDMGTAEAARAIEPLCMLWCIPGFRENRWAHAFKLLHK